MRVALAMAVALSLVSASVAEQAEASIRKHTEIAAQDLGSALKSFAEERGLAMIYRAEVVSKISTSGVSGDLTLDEALRALLSGTELTYKFLDEKTVTIVPIATAPAARSAEDSVLSPEPSASASASVLSPQSSASFWSRFRLSQNDNQSSTSAPSSDDAEDKSVKLEEIVVTAQKREQNLIDVPISITAISGEKLDDDGIADIQDLSFAVPSMSTSEMRPGRQIITLRGIGGIRGRTALTGLYLDEMPISGLQGQFGYADVPTMDLQRVEVLKGPQGTLFGEGAAGGTIRFITNDPNLNEYSGKVAASFYGNVASDDQSKTATGVINVPVVQDKLGFRVEAAYEDTAGWIDRVATPSGPVIDEDINDGELINVRLKGLWQPTEAFALKGTAIVHRAEGGGPSIVNLGPYRDRQFIIEFDPSVRTFYTDNYELYNLAGTYDFGFAQLLSSTSYGTKDGDSENMQRKPLIPAPNPGFQELLQRENPFDGSSFSQEFRLSSDAKPLSWTIGAFYRDQKLRSGFPLGFEFWTFGTPRIVPGQVAPGVFSFGVSDKQRSESSAVFADLSYAITPRLEIGGGARYFEEDYEITGVLQTLPTLIPADSLSGAFHKTTYRGFLSYAINDDIRIYGNAATGFRSGGVNGASAAAAGAPATFDSETVTSYELGTKMMLSERRISVQAAAFLSRYNDIQMNSIFVAANGTPVGITGNPGKADIEGFEAEFSWAVTDRLILGISGDITDTEITQVDERVTPAAPPFKVGDPIDAVPEYSLSASIDYRVQWSPSMPGFVRMQYNRQGERTSTLRSLSALEPITHSSVLDFLNASIGVNWNTWQFEAFARNILDESGALYAQNNPLQARPRTFGVRFEKSF